MTGVEAVIARISELQGRLGGTPATVGAAGAVRTAGGTGTAGTSGTAFAAALNAASAPPAGDLADAGNAGVTGDAVVAAAKKYLGVPYVFGGNDPATGLDCSSLVQRAYGDLGIKLPRIAADQATVGTSVAGLADARPGDILAFNRPVDHVAIYLGNNRMIAAPQPGESVKIQPVYQTPSAIRRVIPAADPTGGAAAVRPAGLTGGTGALAGVPYGDLFARAGAKHGISAKLLAAVAKVESGYRPGAVSPAGAQGLMQLMPGTARELGVTNAFDPAQAVDGAARLLAGHLKDFGSVPLALAAYNAGGGAVRRYGGIPPFAETQAYVPKVQAALAALG